MKRIAVVEDEVYMREELCDILTSMCKSDGTNKGFKGMKSPKPLACYFMKSRHRWSNSSARFSPRF